MYECVGWTKTLPIKNNFVEKKFGNRWRYSEKKTAEIKAKHQKLKANSYRTLTFCNSQSDFNDCTCYLVS